MNYNRTPLEDTELAAAQELIKLYFGEQNFHTKLMIGVRGYSFSMAPIDETRHRHFGVEVQDLYPGNANRILSELRKRADKQ